MTQRWFERVATVVAILAVGVIPQGYKLSANVSQPPPLVEECLIPAPVRGKVYLRPSETCDAASAINELLKVNPDGLDVRLGEGNYAWRSLVDLHGTQGFRLTSTLIVSR